MEENDLKNILLGRGRRALRKGRGCADEARLAAYAERRLAPAARESVEAHLSDCVRCLDAVTFLARATDTARPVEPPGYLIARARRCSTGGRRSASGWGWRWAATAAAACLLLTVGLTLALRTQRLAGEPDQEVSMITPERSQAAPAPGAPDAPAPLMQPPTVPTTPQPLSSPPPAGRTPQARPSARSVRRTETSELTPSVIFPRDGTLLRRDGLEFRWQPVADAVFYEVAVVTAAGDLVSEHKTEGTHLRLPAGAPLATGEKYFVWVRARLHGEKTVRSGFVSFRVLD